jgi:hypothetical protein
VLLLLSIDALNGVIFNTPVFLSSSFVALNDRVVGSFLLVFCSSSLPLGWVFKLNTDFFTGVGWKYNPQ